MVHPELSLGGDKAHRSHRILGWNKPSPRGLGKRKQCQVGQLCPRPAPLTALEVQEATATHSYPTRRWVVSCCPVGTRQAH